MRYFLATLLALFSLQTFAQKTTYVSSADNNLTIKSIALIPMVDNVDGIYAKPLTEHLASLLNKDKQWSLVSLNLEKLQKPEEYEQKPDLVKKLLRQGNINAFISSRLTKGPQGIGITLNLFLASDGLLAAQATLNGYSGYELSDLRTQVGYLYNNLKRKIPYDGSVLSRKGNLVTVNLGLNQGLSEKNDLNVVQIMKVERHPKFHFIVGTERTILGKVRLTKVDDNLSFGTVVSELNEGTIQSGQKFVVENFVTYPEASKTADEKIAGNLTERSDGNLAFGEKAKEWVPQSTPTFGKVGVMFGFSQYTISNNLETSGGLSSTNSFAPSIKASGEMWVNPEWFMSLDLRQYVFSVSNPNGSGTPGTLNVSSSQYSLMAGYNFLVADQFFGPKIQLSGGYSKFSSVVDQSSPTTSFTNQTYTGLVIGLGGSFPLELESHAPISLGANLHLFLSPALSESPVDSGSSSNTVTSFTGFGEYRYSPRLNVKVSLDYDLFSSSFSGTGTRGQAATSSSHAMTTLAAGIEYMF